MLSESDMALQPPFFMNEDIMAETAQLAEFDETLYKVIQVSDVYFPWFSWI
jgi:seryl-tRNA synthetase